MGAGVASISQHEDVARPLSHVSVIQMEGSVIGTIGKREENHGMSVPSHHLYQFTYINLCCMIVYVCLLHIMPDHVLFTFT